MEAIAARFEKIGGTTDITGGLGIPGDDLQRENSVLQSIATECVSAGLAHDVSEAYTVIIPAFSKHKLLPMLSHQEVKFFRAEDGSVSTTVNGELLRYPFQIPGW
jgi:hypothetical protein